VQRLKTMRTVGDTIGVYECIRVVPGRLNGFHAVCLHDFECVGLHVLTVFPGGRERRLGNRHLNRWEREQRRHFFMIYILFFLRAGLYNFIIIPIIGDAPEPLLLVPNIFFPGGR
jgi:hypothetical protein